MNNNKFRKKYFLPLLILVIVFVFLSACYSKGSTGNKEGQDEGTATSSEEKVVVNLIEANDIPTLRPNGEIDITSNNVFNDIYEGLYRIDENNEITEGVAYDYDVTEDGHVYTFHLREDTIWSNGDPVTAHDFVYALRKNVNPETISAHAGLAMQAIKNSLEIQDPDSELYGKAEELGVTALDDYTLEIELSTPISYFMNFVAFSAMYLPQNEEFVEAQGDEYALEPENLIMNGPYLLEEWDHGSSWVLRKNEDYWDADNVKVDEINIKVVGDNATALNLFEVGDVDAIELSSELVELYHDNEDFMALQESTSYFFRFNLQNEFLSNVNIRRSIDMAWDKEEAADKILKNGSKPLYSLVPDDFVIGPNGEDFRDKYYKLNQGSLEEAQVYWQKGLDELGIDSVEIEMMSYDDEQKKSVAEYVVNQLNQNLPGLTVRLNQQPSKVKLEREHSGDYDMAFSRWRNVLPDALTSLEIWHSEESFNSQEFANDEFDRIISEARIDFSDLEKRFSNLQEAERILIEEEVAIAPMYQEGKAYLVKPYIHGIVNHPDGVRSLKWVTIDGK